MNDRVNWYVVDLNDGDFRLLSDQSLEPNEVQELIVDLNQYFGKGCTNGFHLFFCQKIEYGTYDEFLDNNEYAWYYDDDNWVVHFKKQTDMFYFKLTRP